MTGRRRLPRSTPEAHGVDPCALAGLVTGLAELPELHSIMVLRHGAVVAEGWAAPFSADRLHEVFSLSKSVTSTAVGLAVAEGLFGLDDLVLDHFGDRAPREPGERLRRMRVRHLLTMTTGHEVDPTPAVFRSHGDWVAEFLRQPVTREPGTHFVYNTAGTHVLSALVQETTGERLLDYLRPWLFEPLGIEGVTWEQSPTGVDVGGTGLSATTEDIAALGLLYLQDGRWGDRQLLPAGWAAEATSRQVSNGDDPDNDWNQGYGYQFWRCRPANSWRGDGAFGQYMIGLPDQDVVVAITAGRQDMHDYLQVLWDRLLPGLADEPLEPDPEGRRLLDDALAGLRLDPPAGGRTSPAAERLADRTITFGPNVAGIRSAALQLSDERVLLTVGDVGGTLVRTELGYGVPALTRSALRARKYEDVLVSGAWTAPDTYVLTVRYVSSPFVLTVTATVQGDDVTVRSHWNAGFGPLEPFVLHGTVS